VDGTLGTCTAPTTACYVYDPDGNRVEKISTTGGGGDPAGTWQFLYDQSGRMIQRFDGTLFQGNIYAGGRHLAEDGGGTNISHSDWLGTERVRVSYQNNSVCETIASLPFGDGQTTTSNCYQSSPLHFTGKFRDSESNLDYFGARFDASSMGRFMSPDDPSDPDDEGSPQSLNLYSYVQNNPTNATDPDGHDCVFQQGNAVNYQLGDCSGAPADATNVTYVPGSVDPHSGSYDRENGTFSFSYMPYSSNDPVLFHMGGVFPSHPGKTEFEKFASRMTAGADQLNAISFQVGLQAATSAGGGLLRYGAEALLAARAARAAAAAEAVVDLQNISKKIAGQMASRGWTKQVIIDTIKEAQEADTTYPAINKSTGGPATEFVSRSTGKFVVIDNTTKQVIQVSRAGYLPNYMKP